MIFDATPGSAAATSYATVEQFHDYVELRGVVLDFPNEEDVEGALARATSIIDARYGPRFSGRKTNGRRQSLEWPRYGAQDDECYWIRSDTVPIEVVRATLHLAIEQVAKVQAETSVKAEAPSAPTVDATSGLVTKRIRTGPVEVEYFQPTAEQIEDIRNQASSDQEKSMIELLLGPLMTGGGGDRWWGRLKVIRT